MACDCDVYVQYSEYTYLLLETGICSTVADGQTGAAPTNSSEHPPH